MIVRRFRQIHFEAIVERVLFRCRLRIRLRDDLADHRRSWFGTRRYRAGGARFKLTERRVEERLVLMCLLACFPGLLDSQFADVNRENLRKLQQMLVHIVDQIGIILELVQPAHGLCLVHRIGTAVGKSAQQCVGNAAVNVGIFQKLLGLGVGKLRVGNSPDLVFKIIGGRQQQFQRFLHRLGQQRFEVGTFHGNVLRSRVHEFFQRTFYFFIGKIKIGAAEGFGVVFPFFEQAVEDTEVDLSYGCQF